MKQKWIELKGEIENPTLIVDFITILSAIDNRRKSAKKKNSSKHIDLIGIYRILHPTTSE